MTLCQKCGTPNPIGEDVCSKCGTKLMIVSYADRQISSLPMLEEHLLERVSALEYTLGRLDERLNEIHDLVQQLASESFNDHTMIESIADALKRFQIVGKRDLESHWNRRVSERLLETEERDKFERIKRVFLSTFRGKDKNQFTRLIEESKQLFVRKKYRSGLEKLEKAFNADPKNFEVGVFLSKVYYELENFAHAGKCLRRVLKSNPNHFEANLLSGLVARHRGDLSKAREFLSNAVGLCHTSPAAQISLGSVLVALGEDAKAIGHFSQALNLRPSPRMHLLVGGIYSRQGRIRHAIRHMKKAIQLDPGCHEAFFQWGVACLEQNWRRKARECFETALHLNPNESRYKSAVELFVKQAFGAVGEDFNSGSSDEGMETLIKEELRLNFSRLDSEMRPTEGSMESQ